MTLEQLFEYDPGLNLLPCDGEVNYYGQIFDPQTSDFYFNRLLESIPWKHDEAFIGGKRIVTARKVAWIADKSFSYTYSGTTKVATDWTPELLSLKSKVEQLTDTKFNSCLLNLYHNGSEGMAWHSDDEASLGPNTTIGSLSFGAIRKFAFKHKITKHTVSLMLEPSSLLVMKGATQAHWYHRLLTTTTVTEPRINLTFRSIINQ
jgi:alkylated DNA repair dioxygenase AlkB